MNPGVPRRITGTANDGVVSAGPCTIHAVVVGAASAGITATVHNVATEAGAGAGNTVAVLGCDGRTTYGFAHQARLSAGCTVIVSGNCDITVVTS